MSTYIHHGAPHHLASARRLQGTPPGPRSARRRAPRSLAQRAWRRETPYWSNLLSQSAISFVAPDRQNTDDHDHENDEIKADLIAKMSMCGFRMCRGVKAYGNPIHFPLSVSNKRKSVRMIIVSWMIFTTLTMKCSQLHRQYVHVLDLCLRAA